MFWFKKKNNAQQDETDIIAEKRAALNDLFQELFLETATAETGEYDIVECELNREGEHENVLELMYGAGKDGKHTVILEMFNYKHQREIIITIVPEDSVKKGDLDAALARQKYVAKRALIQPIYDEENFKAIRECFAEATQALWSLN